MNEEQHEARMQQMEQLAERMNRMQRLRYGWREGRPIEARRTRLKRLRRWSRLPYHYPDRPAAGEPARWRLVSSLRRAGVELLVVGAMTMIPKTIGSIEGGDLEILPSAEWQPVEMFTGYCRFASKPVLEDHYRGMLTYVPVHGGITYACHQAGVSTYGYDTNHSGDEGNPILRNTEWLEHQAWVMATGIRVASRYEPEYLRVAAPTCRAALVDRYHREMAKRVGAEFLMFNNLGAMLNVLSGRL